MLRRSKTSLLIQKLSVLAISVLCGYVVTLMMIWKGFWFGKKYFQVKLRPNQPSCLSNPNLGRHIVVSLKNVKLHCVENSCSNKVTDSPPLMILLHGFPEFWFSWRNQLTEFNKTYKVIAVDLRGYGYSEKPFKKSSYSRHQIIEDIKELITLMGYQSAVIMGHDWGGAIGCYLASKYPEMVSALVLTNTPHPRALEELLISLNWLQCLKSWYLIFFLLPYIPEIVLRTDDLGILNDLFQTTAEICNDDELEAYKYMYSQPGAFTPPLNYYRMAFSDYFEDLKKGIEKSDDEVRIPTLMVWGQRDYVYQADAAKKSRNYITNLRLECVPNAGHWVQLEYPQKFNALVHDFLSEVL